MARRPPATPSSTATSHASEGVIAVFDLLLIAVIVVGSVRAVRRIRRGMAGPLPDVPDAPAGAEPVAAARYDDNGLATYSFSWLPPRFQEGGDQGRQASARRGPGPDESG